MSEVHVGAPPRGAGEIAMQRLRALGLAVVFAAGCRGDIQGGQKGPGNLVSIAVTPGTADTIPDATVEFTATGSYDDGSTRDVTSAATWSTSDAGVARVSGRVATGVAVGAATITAAVGAVQGSARLTVVTPNFVSIWIDPPAATVAAGGSVALRCLARTDLGVDVDVTRQAIWSTSDPLVATVSGGVATGVKVGGADVHAAFGSFTAQARITVGSASIGSLALGLPSPLNLAVGAHVQARAFARYTDGTQQDVTVLAAWSSTSTQAATVSDVAATAGAIEATGAGSTTIAASYGGKSAAIDVTVVQDSVLFVLVDPVPSPLPVGASLQLRATALHADGTLRDVTAQASWSSDGSSVTVNAAGIATTVSAGTATVRAAYAGSTGLVAITASGSAPSGFQLDTSSITLALGDYTWPPPTATLLYPDGSSYDVSGATAFSVADPTIAVVERSAWDDIVIRGIKLGSTTVQASYGGLTASAALGVVAPASFTLDAPARVPNGSVWRIHAESTFQGKYVVETVDASQYAEWSSSAPGVITVSNAPGTKGEATAVGSGSATLTATFGGLTATKTVTVVAAASSITLSPSTLIAVPQATTPITATATLVDGTTTDVTRMVTWRCDSRVGAFYDPGQFYAGSPGTALITAALGDLVGTATATVVDEPRGLAIRPSLPYGVQLPVGHTAQLRAVFVYNIGGRDVDVPVQGDVIWSSDTPAVAAFDAPASPGRVHALSAGSSLIHATAAGPTGTAMTALATLGTAVATGPFVLSSGSIPLGGSVPLDVTVPFGTATGSVGTFFTYDSSAPAVVETRFVASWPAPAPTMQALGMSLGTATLSAKLDEVTVTAPVQVVAATPKQLQVYVGYGLTVGQTYAPYATLVFDSGDRADITALATWDTTTPATAQVSGTPPVVTALAAGTATIRASWNGFTGSSSVTVSGLPQAIGLAFDAPSYELPVGGVASLRLLARDTWGSTADVANLADITISDPLVASLAAPGAYGSLTGLERGTALLTASYGGLTAFAVVDVTGEVGWFTMFRNGIARGPLHLHQRDSYTAWSFGNRTSSTVTGDLAWASSDPAVVKVIGPGSVEAVAPGAAFVTAASGTSLDSLPVPVSSAAVSALELEGWAPTVPVGGRYGFRATVVYADGATGTADQAITWWSADPTIADFDPAHPGVVLAKKAGVVRIEARLDGVAEPAQVTVY